MPKKQNRRNAGGSGATITPEQAFRLEDLDPQVQRRLLVTFLREQGMTLKEARAVLVDVPSPTGHWDLAAATATKDLQRAGFDKWIFTQVDRERFHETLCCDVANKLHHEPWVPLEKGLQGLSGGVFKHLRVFYSGGKAKPKDEEWPWIIDRFAQNSARCVSESIQGSKRIAVCWGTTVAAVVAALSRLDRPPRQLPQNHVRVYPTAGEPLGDNFRAAGIDSTSIARRLSEYLNGSSQHVPSLDNVPPIIPPKHRDSADVREFLRDINSHRQIFGDGPTDKSSLLAKVDTIIASCGAFHKWQMFTLQWMKGSDDPKRVALGDIGGALLQKGGVSSQEFEKVSRLWTGVEIGHFEMIARREPGVVLCAVGANKAGVVLECIRRGLVTVLVVDYELARSLAPVAAAQTQPSRHPAAGRR